MVSLMPRGPRKHDEHRAAEPQLTERGCVRRGPAAAAPKPRRRLVELAPSPAADLLRLVLRAHSRAPGKVLAAHEDFAAALAAGRRPRNCRQRLALRPGGTPQEISRGQARAAGAAPGCAAKRPMPQRGIEEVFGGVLPATFSAALVASDHFLRCPVGARSHAARYPGAASAGADLPPANLLRGSSGTGTGRPRAVHRSGRRDAAGTRRRGRLRYRERHGRAAARPYRYRARRRWRTRKRAPRGSLGRQAISQPWAETICWTTARPRPVPF